MTKAEILAEIDIINNLIGGLINAVQDNAAVAEADEEKGVQQTYLTAESYLLAACRTFQRAVPVLTSLPE